LRHNSAIFYKFINTLLHNILFLSQLSELRSCSYSRLLDTRRQLSPAERHTNSSCLQCLAHRRACLWGFRLEQASSGHAATIIRIRCMHDYSTEYEYTIRPTIRTE